MNGISKDPLIAPLLNSDLSIAGRDVSSGAECRRCGVQPVLRVGLPVETFCMLGAEVVDVSGAPPLPFAVVR